MHIYDLNQTSKRLIRYSRQIKNAVWNEIRLHRLGQRCPVKPTTLNLLVNDICNSRCQMCLIWQRKRDTEITPDELATILRDPLFDRLRTVGVSGGEPTLRSDLPELFRVITEKRPRVSAAGIITNAIQADHVLQRVTAAADICRQAGVRFNVMVSLDGVGEVHDRIRGRQGNFESAIRVIRHLRDQTDIPVLFGCTITKDSVWHVDELLDFVRFEKLYGRFRIAEFIQRLYNDSQGEYIRNFTPEEAFHLALFFTKLEREFETNPLYQRTYRNIRAMLFEGSPRTIGCPYQTHAVVLDSRGHMLYCSPKSTIIGSTLENSAQQLYSANISTRRQIMEHDCQNCIHDYHADASLKELAQNVQTYSYHRRLHVNRVLPRSKKVPFRTTPAGQSRHALIVGWYGTETAGDKAILGEILHQLRQEGISQVTLASIYPFLSEQTIRELGEPDVRIIPTYGPELRRAASTAYETIMGGGPLMDLAALGAMLQAFTTAKSNHKRTRIAGCGIGPLKQPQYIAAVQQMLRLADVIELRDQASVEWAVEHTGRQDIARIEDPALGFVQRWQSSQSGQLDKQKILNCYFREWPRQYGQDMSDEQFDVQRVSFEQQLGKWIAEICQQRSLRPRLMAMHHFVIGGDDREFNRLFARQHLTHLEPIVEIRPFSVQDILRSMQETTLCLTMRFHSTLFAHTLGSPFLAIDYTGGGKVHNFLAEHQALNHLVTIEEVVQGIWPALPESF